MVLVILDPIFFMNNNIQNRLDLLTYYLFNHLKSLKKNHFLKIQVELILLLFFLIHLTASFNLLIIILNFPLLNFINLVKNRLYIFSFLINNCEEYGKNHFENRILFLHLKDYFLCKLLMRFIKFLNF